ncbi:GNAT family N-acetyltransferase [Sphingobium yanoikuyae]|uniref:GNAT family N-acetyltransferase n=1 Tax=Sphingobium yanoikuyae TaxID=13690 RepID=A0A9X7UBR1_SPHYA|nr:GNAT family N-acetyltransferase [Sphingobium yanoikuyae]QNG43485.1 GNAT family N-acetyltransferase [Sphingobium yanoikuyae]
MSSPSLDRPASDAGGATATTRTGLDLRIRHADTADEERLAAFFENVTLEDLRFRFLSAVQHVGHDQIDAMLRGDDRSETFLAFDPANRLLVGVATLATDDAAETAEVAVSVHRDWKGRGIGWALLSHAAQVARASGILRLQSIESRDNHAAIEVERDLGFTARAYPGDPTLVLVEADLAGDAASGT